MIKSTFGETGQSNTSFLKILFPCALGVLFTIYVFYPGFITPDAIDQISQARQGVFQDWHPPLMAWLWGKTDQIIPGPFGMLLFHNILFWFGAGILFDSIAPASARYLKNMGILAAGLYLPIFLLLSTIYKDVGMASAFLFGVACLVYAQQKKSVSVFWFGLLALWYGTGIRHNGFIALIPILVYAGMILSEITWLGSCFGNKRWAGVCFLAIALFAIMQLTVKGFNNYLTRYKTTYPDQQIFVYDLVGISVRLDSVKLPEYLLRGEKPTMDDLKLIYHPGGGNHIFWGDHTTLRITNDPKDISELSHLWLTTVTEHPKAYLLHRMTVFNWVFGTVGEKACYAFTNGDKLNLVGLRYVPGKLTAMFLDAGLSSHINYLLRAWIYFAILTIIIIYSVIGLLGWNKNIVAVHPAILIISLSGWLYGCAYFFISTTCDFRLHFWMIVSAVISLISMFISKISRPSSQL